MSFFKRRPKFIRNFSYEQWIKGIPHIKFVDQELMQAIRMGNMKRQRTKLQEREAEALIDQIKDILSKGEFVTEEEKEQLMKEVGELEKQVRSQPTEIREYLEKNQPIPTKNNVLVINDLGYKIEFDTSEELIEQLEAIENEKIGDYRIKDIIRQSFESLFDRYGISQENMHDYKDYINNIVFITANKKQRQKYKDRNMLYFPHGHAYKDQDIQLTRNDPNINFKLGTKTSLRDTKTISIPIRLGTKVEEVGDIVEEEGYIKLKLNELTNHQHDHELNDFIEHEINSKDFTKKYNIQHHDINHLVAYLDPKKNTTIRGGSIRKKYIQKKKIGINEFRRNEDIQKEIMQGVINDALKWEPVKKSTMPENFLNTEQIRKRGIVQNPTIQARYQKILDDLITHSHNYSSVANNKDTYKKFESYIHPFGMNRLTGLADYLKHERIKEGKTSEISDWKVILEDYQKNKSKYTSPSNMYKNYNNRVKKFLEERKKAEQEQKRVEEEEKELYKKKLEQARKERAERRKKSMEEIEAMKLVSINFPTNNDTYNTVNQSIEDEINSKDFFKKYNNIEHPNEQNPTIHHNTNDLNEYIKRQFSASTVYNKYITKGGKGWKYSDFMNDDNVLRVIMQKIINDSLRYKRNQSKKYIVGQLTSRRL